MADSMLDSSKALRREFFEGHAELLERLVDEGQHPEALFVGCSDSRVTPESLFGAMPGDFFMVRNVANIIPPYFQTEIGVTSALEFAILHLKVPHLIVCGHTDCGGIKGLDTMFDLSKEPSLSRWLELARPAQRDVDLAPGKRTVQERHTAIVEQNVLLQLAHAQSYPFVREALEANRLELHGWVYYLESQQLGRYDPVSNSFAIV